MNATVLGATRACRRETLRSTRRICMSTSRPMPNSPTARKMLPVWSPVRTTRYATSPSLGESAAATRVGSLLSPGSSDIIRSARRRPLGAVCRPGQVRREALLALLSSGDGPTGTGARELLSIAVGGLLRGHRQRTRNRVAAGGLAESPRLSRAANGDGTTGSLDDLADASCRTCGSTTRSVFARRIWKSLLPRRCRSQRHAARTADRLSRRVAPCDRSGAAGRSGLRAVRQAELECAPATGALGPDRSPVRLDDPLRDVKT
jgi:hypothetical protein